MGGIRTAAEVFGAYHVFERLGAGGMATVHRSVKMGIAGFEREVALKRLLPHLAKNRDFVASFVREAKLVSRLRHPNIAHVYELGKVGDTYFITMEYVDGHDLRDILRHLAREQLFIPMRIAVAILVELCEALDYAHSRTDDLTGEPLGIIHRDVSPSNVILTESGHVKVIDFGIAKGAHRELNTQSGRVKGKFGYMSREALEGHRLDARSDIFSVGVLAHELLTSRRLFGSTNTYEGIARLHRAEIAPPSVLNRDCTPELDALVLRALERDPDERFQSAAEIRDALHSIARQARMDITSDQTAEWLDYLFGDAIEIEIEVDGEEFEIRVDAEPDEGHEATLVGWGIVEESSETAVESIEQFTFVSSELLGEPPPATPLVVALPEPKKNHTPGLGTLELPEPNTHGIPTAPLAAEDTDSFRF